MRPGSARRTRSPDGGRGAASGPGTARSAYPLGLYLWRDLPNPLPDQVARTHSGRKYLAVHAGQLTLQRHLPVLRGHPRPPLLCLEQAGRPALVDYVHWLARLDPSVMITGIRTSVTPMKPQPSITRQCPTTRSPYLHALNRQSRRWKRRQRTARRGFGQRGGSSPRLGRGRRQVCVSLVRSRRTSHIR